MNALVYNNQMMIGPHIEAVMLQCSYLLLNKTIAAGNTRQFYHLFLKKNENFNEKLKFLEGSFKGHEGFEDAQRAIRLFKDFKKMKHPPASMIVAHKKLQKGLEAEYENQTGMVVRTIDETRLISIDELAPHGYFNWFHIDDKMLHVPAEKQKHVSTQDMLQLLPQQMAGEPFLFVLPINLIIKADVYKDTYQYNSGLPPSMQHISFLHTCFELPNVLLLSFSELHAVKMQLQSPFELFDNAMNRWLQLCIENNPASATIDFFKNEVLPCAQEFQTALHNNPILNQHTEVGNDRQRIYFSLGEISLCEVWQLLRQNGMIPCEEVWNEMTEMMKESRFQQRRPFLLLSSFLSDEEEVTERNVPFKKKSLSID